MIRCREDADIYRDGGAPAHPGELPILEDVQELPLERGVEVPDLVQEDGSTVGGLKLAELELVGAREGSPLMSEQLAFQ